MSKKTCVWVVKYELVKTNLTLRTRLNATASCISTIFPKWTAVTSKTLLLPVIVVLLNVKTKIIRTCLQRRKTRFHVLKKKNCNLMTKLSANLCKKKCKSLLRNNQKLTEQFLRQTVRLTRLSQHAARIRKILSSILVNERKR